MSYISSNVVIRHVGLGILDLYNAAKDNAEFREANEFLNAIISAASSSSTVSKRRKVVTIEKATVALFSAQLSAMQESILRFRKFSSFLSKYDINKDKLRNAMADLLEADREYNQCLSRAKSNQKVAVCLSDYLNRLNAANDVLEEMYTNQAPRLKQGVDSLTNLIWYTVTNQTLHRMTIAWLSSAISMQTASTQEFRAITDDYASVLEMLPEHSIASRLGDSLVRLLTFAEVDRVGNRVRVRQNGVVRELDAEVADLARRSKNLVAPMEAVVHLATQAVPIAGTLYSAPASIFASNFLYIATMTTHSRDFFGQLYYLLQIVGIVVYSYDNTLQIMQKLRTFGAESITNFVQSNNFFRRMKPEALRDILAQLEVDLKTPPEINDDSVILDDAQMPLLDIVVANELRESKLIDKKSLQNLEQESVADVSSRLRPGGRKSVEKTLTEASVILRQSKRQTQPATKGKRQRQQQQDVEAVTKKKDEIECVINPATRKQIRVGGKVYKTLHGAPNLPRVPCLQKKNAKKNESLDNSIKCFINPTTGRKIKSTGVVYRKMDTVDQNRLIPADC